MEGIQTLKGSWPWPSIRPYGISSCSSHRPLRIYQISFKLKKLFVDGRTYGRTYGRTFLPSILLGRLSEVDLKMSPVITFAAPCLITVYQRRGSIINVVTQSQTLVRWELPRFSKQLVTARACDGSIGISQFSNTITMHNSQSMTPLRNR